VALSIKHPEADSLARELSRITGESLTDAVLIALRERLSRHQGVLQAKRNTRLEEELTLIRQRCARLKDLDPREPDEIIGYDDQGLPS